MSYIKINNVSKIYKSDNNVYLALKNINLEFNKNEFVAILGPSGCGKSTLLNLIAGISDITKGSIYVNGENIANFSKRKMDKYRKKEIGIIFQKYNLIKLLNTYQNIELIKENNINKNKIKELFNKINLSKKIHSKVNELSGGEAQRIACIRALINEPPILILDEPTGALDSVNGNKLMEYINSIKKDKLILFVTHNKDLAKKYASRIIEMKDGKVIKDNYIKKDENDFKNYNDLNTKIKTKFKLIYIFNLINKKKGRFIISLLSSILVLFFLSISLIAMNVSKDYVNNAFLSSLDANIIDLKSYIIDDKELKETEISSIILKDLEENKSFNIRKNYNEYLLKSIRSTLTFNNKNKKINLNNVDIKCYSSYLDFSLSKGNIPLKYNEIIINENLYNYLLEYTDIILNKRLYYGDDYLIIKGVSKSSLLNDSLTIYFNYDFVNEKHKLELINKYQIEILDLNNINKIISYLESKTLYKTIDNINDNSINFTLEYNLDLENYYVFYDLINLACVVIYFFLGLTIVIAIMLLSNVIYSFNEEEKRNIGLLRVLGFSSSSVYSLNIILSLVISLLSYLISIYINHIIDTKFSNYLSNLLDYNVNLKINIMEYILLLTIIIFFSLLSSIFPIIKLNKLKLDDILKEE